MADKKISDLTALSTQATTDLYETSANGTGSFKETRAQQKAYWDAIYAQTTGAVTAGHLVVYGVDGKQIKDCGIPVDTSQNIYPNNNVIGYATTATAAGTTTLTLASKCQQFFTGSTTQTVLLPVTSTLSLGFSFYIVNNSTGAVTVQSSGGNTIQVMAANSTLLVTCILTSGTGTASWNARYIPSSLVTSNYYVAVNGNNTTGNGSFFKPYADPVAAMTAITGGDPAANPCIVMASGDYTIASNLATKSWVSIFGTRNCFIFPTASEKMTIGSSYGGDGNVWYSNLGIACQVDMSFESQTVTGNQIYFADCQLDLVNFTDKGQSNVFHLSSSIIGDVVTLKSANSIWQSCILQSTLDIDKSTTGGSATHAFNACEIDGNITLTGVGQALRITNSRIAGSITITGASATLSIDATSYPVGGISYAGGATSAQVTLLTHDDYIYATSTRTNYTPTAATVEGNLAGIDSALGAIVPAQNINTNILIGGNFDTNPFQRGTSFTAPVTTSYVADRWQWGFSGGGVVNTAKTADAPVIGSAGILVNNCLAISTTTADASIGASDIYRLSTFIEGQAWAQAAQQALTLTFWVKSTKTGTFCFTAFNSGQDRAFIAEYTVNTTNTWEKKTISITASPSAGTWTYTSGTYGLQLNWTLASGSNYQGSTGWQTSSGALYSTSNQVNAMDSNTNVFKLALVKLEIGTTATTYPYEDPADVLERCQRFYETSTNFPDGTYFPTSNAVGRVVVNCASAASTGAMGTPVFFKATKSLTPTITLCDDAGTTGVVYKGASGQTAAVVSTGINGFQGGSGTAQSANGMIFQYQAVAELA